MKKKPTFSEAARLAGQKARKRNNLLRRQGKLPPIKGGKTGKVVVDTPKFGEAHIKEEETNIPLDSPIFDKVVKKSYNKTKPDLKPSNRELVEQMISLMANMCEILRSK